MDSKETFYCRVHSRVGCDLQVWTWLGDAPGWVLDSRVRIVMIVACVRRVRCGAG
jgi:hypothetical protein